MYLKREVRIEEYILYKQGNMYIVKDHQRYQLDLIINAG